ncbi:mediator of RNA polymerase II transcription subunit 14 [Parastagonospora nodorum]|nr:mediator of RNA polymerase II transcription subunit 14 [Parastagonospora nodorum]KAH4289876.1 mediator of RNA polymerase II transcription subunit 14 [Parastagonospora nodorum]KAH4322039.1 mediator of RNA polymerase II transcription subunit 14 [Parastagonospora nodorum]KAH4357840.1 mediator of RNA polymerase II transcription subunit 14 [Parastagonospora nodorum]KAH4448682.1 mediator of RNA polymerase II transcription subunit 14 [Parastagonospora nodorum]
MNQDSGAAAGLSNGENKKRSFEGKMVNGEPKTAPGTPTVNGAPSTGPGSALAVSAPLVPTPDALAELPPEIAHITQEHYHPLSTLLLRISQETYNDLSETLQAMAQMPLAPQTNGVMTNGAGAHRNAQENEEVNRRKKLLLMKFAQDNRAKFIKLLVLTEWGKKASANVARLIDLYAWATAQREHVDFLPGAIEAIKIYTNAAAERNPDIATAIEILSTGKAPWMPSLGYIPPEPISPEQALKLLRYVNTTMSIRLNVHESLPRHLQDWRIESGRTTFVMGKELEFDVISFSEDTSEQWWLVDLRLLFSPAPTITVNSHFFERVQMQANAISKEKGLVGLFDFFNNFVLTHKISVLRSQALALVRSEWAGSLKVENVHRELVVSYWTDRPTKKNWIELGISKNNTRKGKSSWRGQSLPSLNMRWFRQGVEVKDFKLDFDWHNLSFERVIKRIIACHASDILRSTHESLNPQLVAGSSLSDSEPADCKLQVSLGTSGNAATLSLEPVTGSYILQPATHVTARAEHAFNQGREPKVMANILTEVLAQTLHELVQKHAQQLGWHNINRPALPSDSVKSAVKLAVIRYAMYTPRGWSSTWALGNVVDATGSSWWIFEIGKNGTAIEHAEQIKMDRPDGSTLAITRSTLASLERVAVQLLSARVTVRQLEKEKKQFSLRYELGQQKSTAQAERVTRGLVLHVHTNDLLTSPPGEEPWLESNLAIICQGFRSGDRTIWHIVAGKMKTSVAADMQKLMAASPQKGFKFSADGSFRILLSTPFGQDILGELRGRLRDVNRLRSFATTLQKREMRLGSSSLQRVEFRYGPSSHVAAVSFGAEKEIAIEMSHKNPHHRVHKMLTDIANSHNQQLPGIFTGDANGLDRFCTTLLVTRPLVTALQALEANDANVNARNPATHAHSLFKYRLAYENPVCTFDVRVQPKDDKVYWFIEDNMKKHTPDLRPTPERNPTHQRLETLQEKLKEFFSSKGERWFGTRNGLVAEIDGVGEALSKLNECVLSCTMEGGYKAPPPLVLPAAQPQTQQPQAQQPQMTGQQQQQQQQQIANQQRLQQQARQQQAQQQGQRRPPQQNQQQNGRPQMQNGRPPQQQQPQGRPNGRPGQGQDVITID